MISVFFSRILVFCFSLLTGIAAYSMLSVEYSEKPQTPSKAGGIAVDEMTVTSEFEEHLHGFVRPGSNNLRLLSKPRPDYTNEARQNNEQGTVILRVVFLADGEIGLVEPTKGLNHGLTEKAMAAARLIKFQPPTRDGIPYSIAKQVEYTFTIY